MQCCWGPCGPYQFILFVVAVIADGALDKTALTDDVGSEEDLYEDFRSSNHRYGHPGGGGEQLAINEVLCRLVSDRQDKEGCWFLLWTVSEVNNQTNNGKVDGASNVIYCGYHLQLGNNRVWAFHQSAVRNSRGQWCKVMQSHRSWAGNSPLRCFWTESLKPLMSSLVRAGVRLEMWCTEGIKEMFGKKKLVYILLYW